MFLNKNLGNGKINILLKKLRDVANIFKFFIKLALIIYTNLWTCYRLFYNSNMFILSYINTLQQYTGDSKCTTQHN